MSLDVIQEKPTNWLIIAVAVGAGIAAGLQIGKVPPALPLLRDELNADLVTAGWIISVFNLLAAILGIASGLAADRLGSRRMAAGGLVMLALGALAGSMAADTLQLIAARIVAGLGLVSVAVSAPRLIVSVVRSNDRDLALGIWGIYTPAGMALGMLCAPLLLSSVGWRGLWLADALLLMIFLVIFLYATRDMEASNVNQHKVPSGWRDVAQVITHPGPWLLGILFALYAIQFFAVMSWLPTFLIETQNYTTGVAATAAAVVVACNVIGNLGAAWMLHHGGQRWLLQLVALLVMAVCGVGIFADFVTASLKLPLALLFSTAGGMLPAATLAASAVHAPSPGHVATVNGVIVQCTNVGSLSGPPLLALVVSLLGGWQESWKLLIICALLGVICIFTIRQVEQQRLIATEFS